MFTRLVLCIYVLIAFTANANAQAPMVSGSVEYAHYILDSDATPEIHAYLKGPIRGKIGWTTWTLNNGSWSEALVGLYLTPTSWMEVSASAGIERDDEPARFGSSIWLGKGKVSFLGLVEKGGSGSWHKETLTYQATKRIGLGLLDQKFLGYGPYMEVAVKKTALWGAIVGKRSGALGIRLNF